jgi:hypothetical protein
MLRLVACLGVCLSFASAARAAEPLVMYPNTIGSEWVYMNGPLQIMERVARYEKVGDEMCARIETVYAGKVLSFEHLAFRPDGIYRTAVAGQLIQPAFCFLKLPPQNGDQWQVKSLIAKEELAGSFKTEITKVKVPAGEFQVLEVEGRGFKAGDKPLEFDTCFAPSVGKVKHVVKIDGKETVLELKSFKPGTGEAAKAAMAP